MQMSLKALLIGLVLVTMGAGCTVNEWRVGNVKVSMNAPNIGENRCDELLTLEQANALTGITFTKRKATVSSNDNHLFNQTTCEYTATSGSASGSRLYFDAYVEPTKERTYARYSFWKEREAISGLGDEAQWVPGLSSVWVMIGNVTMSFGSIERDKLEAVARIVVPRFDKTDWAQQMRDWSNREKPL